MVEQNDWGKARILLVDDRPENLLALEATLSALDQQLVRAGSGEEALKALLLQEFALILLDVHMPGMDGFETAGHIKARESTRDIPIIFLTADDRSTHHTFRGYAAGAVDYVTKPFDPWVLRSKVAVFVKLYAQQRQLRAQQAAFAGGAEAAEAAGATPSAAFLRSFARAAEVSLAEAEESAAGLADRLRDAKDGESAAAADRLTGQLADLRRALDELAARLPAREP
ncbi:response regulator [Yinghuangia soli]|uniref:Response regulator n=1 Tax=Yinghuangia soli TaxID=2908204 RepID=A0AA41PX04_9ACTN|nr:response regulator [Yinghuangia soli]MCF2526092.1 response regulator [Yinghuangia soli]